MLNIDFRKKNSLNVIYICPFFGIFCSFLDILIRFLADPPGTHWYHSHLGTERTDGLSGALIVLPKPDKTIVTPLFSYSDSKQTFQLDTFIIVNAYELSIMQNFFISLLISLKGLRTDLPEVSGDFVMVLSDWKLDPSIETKNEADWGLNS